MPVPPGILDFVLVRVLFDPDMWPRRLVVKDAWFSAMRSRVRIPSGLPTVKRKTFSVEVFRFLLLQGLCASFTRECKHESLQIFDVSLRKSRDRG